MKQVIEFFSVKVWRDDKKNTHIHVGFGFIAACVIAWLLLSTGLH